MATADAALRLRQGHPSDAVALARIQSRAAVAGYAYIFPPAAPKPTTEALTPSWTDVLVDPTTTVIVAEDAVMVDGGVVVRAEPTAPSGFLLERLYVDPSHWGCGIGGLLHDEAIRAAWRRGARGVNLWVLVQNHRAREMYERRGWRLVAGEQLAHTDPPITEVRYELELSDDVELRENKEGPAGGSRSFVPRETMLGGTCSTSTSLSVGECSLFDHRAIRPIRRVPTATRPTRQAR